MIKGLNKFTSFILSFLFYSGNPQIKVVKSIITKITHAFEEFWKIISIIYSPQKNRMVTKSFGTKYSTIDQEKFVEDSF